jgi:hypothetical protein
MPRAITFLILAIYSPVIVGLFVALHFTGSH